MVLKACFHFFPSLARSHCLCFIFRRGLKVISHKQDQYMEHIRDFSERSGDFQRTDQPSERGLEQFFPFFHWQSLSIAFRESRGKANLTAVTVKLPVTPVTFASRPVVSQHMGPICRGQNLHMSFREHGTINFTTRCHSECKRRCQADSAHDRAYQNLK